MLKKGEPGYLVSKQRAEKKRQVVHTSSGAQPFEKVLQAADDENVYDTDADDEADQLEIDIEWKGTIRSDGRRNTECK